MVTYSKDEIRQILCRYHNLDGAEEQSGKTGVEAIMNRIHSIQYDPLKVVARNADLVLQARVRDYKESVLYDLLYKEHQLIDGVDKEMCIYSAKEFTKFEFIRKASQKQLENTFMHRKQLEALEILDEVREFVSKNGRTGTKDISIGQVREGSWGHKKLSSAALDYLYNGGELCVVDKKGTQKYFDLTERVIKDEHLNNDSNMSIDEFLEWYIERRIQSVGLVWNKQGGTWLGQYLNKRGTREQVLRKLLEQKRIEEIRIEGVKEKCYIPSHILEYNKCKKVANYARFLAPLDNIMWDRKLIEEVFDFAYSWEVYTPVVKRKFGYYVLPVLYNGQFVARFEPEYISKVGRLEIKKWWWEPDVKKNEEMLYTIEKELQHFAEFLEVENARENRLKLR